MSPRRDEAAFCISIHKNSLGYLSITSEGSSPLLV